jgi:hypothetical protein
MGNPEIPKSVLLKAQSFEEVPLTSEETSLFHSRVLYFALGRILIQSKGRAIINHPEIADKALIDALIDAENDYYTRQVVHSEAHSLVQLSADYVQNLQRIKNSMRKSDWLILYISKFEQIANNHNLIHDVQRNIRDIMQNPNTPKDMRLVVSTKQAFTYNPLSLSLPWGNGPFNGPDSIWELSPLVCNEEIFIKASHKINNYNDEIEYFTVAQDIFQFNGIPRLSEIKRKTS